MPHIHEKIDLTVEVFVVHAGRVLLRKHDKYGIWLSVGGHVELEEDPNEAALREVKEETGLEVVLADDLLVKTKDSDGYKELIPPKFLNRHRISDTHEHVSMTYFARSWSGDAVDGEEERSGGMRWFSDQDLDDPEITERVRVYAKCALKELG